MIATEAIDAEVQTDTPILEEIPQLLE